MGFIGAILSLLLFAVIFVAVVGLILFARLMGGIRNLWNLITGQGKKANHNGNNSYYTNGGGYYDKGSNSNQHSGTSANQGNRPHSKGVFSDDEGTYVDFEEIKDGE